MGMNDRQESKSRKRKPKRAKVVLGGSEEELGDAIDYRAVDWGWLSEVIIRVTDADAAVMLTKSRDSGALGMRLYHDLVEVKTYYFRPDDVVTMRKLEEIVRELETLEKE